MTTKKEHSDADVLRAAINYALHREDDGLEWLRNWNEGGPEEMRELEEVLNGSEEHQMARLHGITHIRQPDGTRRRIA